MPISYLELLGTTLEKRQCLSQDLEDHFSRKSLDGERVHGEGSSGGQDSRWRVLEARKQLTLMGIHILL